MVGRLWFDRCVGSWDLSFPRFSQASEHLTMSCLVTVIEFSSLVSAVTSSPAQGVGGIQLP